MKIEPDWLTNFVITVEDLQRLEKWMNELMQGVSIEELSRRIIRGRIIHGKDESPSALPEWVQEQHVLSWDEEEKWCIGCQVLVVKGLTTFFGVIEDINIDTFFIRINNEIVKYVRGSKDAKTYYENVRKRIWDFENRQRERSAQVSLDEQINLNLLKTGAVIASKIVSALKRDTRFILWNDKWYLHAWIRDISIDDLHRVHRQILKTTPIAHLDQILSQIPSLQGDELGELSLAQALSNVPELFQRVKDGWQVIPPAWDKAVGAFYVYDPQTYQIILQPGQKLTKKLAEKLQALDFYQVVVVPAKESTG